MRIAKRNPAHCKGRSFSQGGVVVHYKIIREGVSFRGEEADLLMATSFMRWQWLGAIGGFSPEIAGMLVIKG